MGVIYNAYDRTEEVMEDTWGHLKADVGTYEGWILVYYSCYGDYGILDWEYGDVKPNPWQYSRFCAWVDKWVDRNNRDGVSIKTGIYKYTGKYTVKENGYEFETNDFELIDRE